MVFSNVELPYVFNKIVEEINELITDKKQIEVQDLERILLRFRLTTKDSDYFVKHFHKQGLMTRKGSVIYVHNKLPITETKKNGRPKKLTEDEIKWAREKYEPGVFGVLRLTKEINKKRNGDPVHFTTVFRAL